VKSVAMVTISHWKQHGAQRLQYTI